MRRGGGGYAKGLLYYKNVSSVRVRVYAREQLTNAMTRENAPLLTLTH